MEENNIIFGGKYLGDKEEVVRVFAIYHTLDKERKMNILLVLKD
jgi:hypothetical protein